MDELSEARASTLAFAVETGAGGDRGSSRKGRSGSACARGTGHSSARKHFSTSTSDELSSCSPRSVEDGYNTVHCINDYERVCRRGSRKGHLHSQSCSVTKKR